MTLQEELDKQRKEYDRKMADLKDTLNGKLRAERRLRQEKLLDEMERHKREKHRQLVEFKKEIKDVRAVVKNMEAQVYIQCNQFCSSLST